MEETNVDRVDGGKAKGRHDDERDHDGRHPKRCVEVIVVINTSSGADEALLFARSAYLQPFDDINHSFRDIQ